jgi:hypothetical protein
VADFPLLGELACTGAGWGMPAAAFNSRWFFGADGAVAFACIFCPEKVHFLDNYVQRGALHPADTHLRRIDADA